MSYNPDPNAPLGQYPIGLQQFDIAALQEMYGVNYTTRNGDTEYKFSTSPGILTIWDGGGKDKIDTQGITDRVVIDLQPGKFSSIGGKENVAMALVSHLAKADQAKPLLENVQSGKGNDDITGNNVKNILQGGAGTNKLWGLGGDDFLISDGLNDTLSGGAGNDTLVNHQNDGNTRYVFGKGDGHDGVLDNPFHADNIDILLQNLAPGDINLVVKDTSSNHKALLSKTRLPLHPCMATARLI